MRRLLLWIGGLLAISIAGYIGYSKANDEIHESKRRLERKVNDLMVFRGTVTVSEWYAPKGYFDNKGVVQYDDEDMVWVQDDAADKFEIVRLEEDADGWRKDTYQPVGLQYTTPKYYKNFYWGWTRNYRYSVEECYSFAYEQLRNGKEDEYSGTTGWYVYDKVADFPKNYFNNFHKVKLSWHDEDGYRELTTEDHVEVEDAYVFYNQTTQFYKIVEKKDEAQSYLLINTLKGAGIGIVVTLFFWLLMRLINTTPARVHQLLNIEWTDTANDITLRFEKKGGAYLVYRVEKGKMKKGKVTFSEQGKKIKIRFQDSVLNAEQRVSLDNETLELKNADTGSTLVFKNANPLI